MPAAGKTICVTTDIPLTAGIIVPLRLKSLAEI